MSDAARALAFAESLARGFVSPAEVLLWLDSLILATDEPSETLIDAALARDDRNRLITLLRELGADANPTVVARYRISDMAALFDTEEASANKIANALYCMASYDEQLPHPEVQGDMYRFDDALELAGRRVYGEIEEVLDELRLFLKKHGH